MRHMKIFSKHEIMVRHRVQNLISINKVRFLLGVVVNGLTGAYLGRGIFLGHLNKNPPTAQERKALQGKNHQFFCLETLKNPF